MVPTQPELYKSHNHLFCFSVSLFDSVTLVQTHLQNSKYRVWKKNWNINFNKSLPWKISIGAVVDLNCPRLFYISPHLSVSATALVPALSGPGCYPAFVPPAEQPWPASSAPLDSGSPAHSGPSSHSAPHAILYIARRPDVSPAVQRAVGRLKLHYCVLQQIHIISFWEEQHDPYHIICHWKVFF